MNEAVARQGADWQRSFANRVQSGDRVQIQRALGDLGRVYRDVLAGRFGAAKVDQAVHQAQQQLSRSGTDVMAQGAVNYNDKINLNYSVAAAALALAVVVAGLVLVLVVLPVAPADDATIAV